MDVGGVEDLDGGIVVPADDNVCGGDAMAARRGGGGRARGGVLAVDAGVEGVADFPGVGDEEGVLAGVAVGAPGGQRVGGHGHRVAGVEAVVLAVPTDRVAQGGGPAVA